MKIECPDCKTVIVIDELAYDKGDVAKKFCPRCGAMVSSVIEQGRQKKDANKKTESTADAHEKEDSYNKHKEKELELKKKELELKEKELELKRIQQEREANMARKDKPVVEEPVQETVTRVYHEPVRQPESPTFDQTFSSPPQKSGSSALWYAIGGVALVVILIWIFASSGSDSKMEDSETVTEAVEDNTYMQRENAETILAGSLPSNGSMDQFAFLANQRLTPGEISHLSKWELKVLRNAIFARHGYKFKTKTLKDYFGQFYDYHPYTSQTPDLNNIEIANVELIKSYE